MAARRHGAIWSTALVLVACAEDGRGPAPDERAGAGGEDSSGAGQGPRADAGRTAGGEPGFSAGAPSAGASAETLPVPAILQTPALVELSGHPDPGQHPRLFFTASDAPELRARAQTVPGVIAAVARLRDELAALQETPVYRAFRDGQTVSTSALSAELVSDSTRMFLGTAAGGFYGQLAAGAYLSVLDEDEALASELATVLAGAASVQAATYEPNLTDDTGSDANLDLAFSYDLLFSALTLAQRDSVRALLAAMTAGRTVYGVNRAPQQQSTGERVQHDSLVLTSLAIEGEAGYDATLYDDNLDKLRNFSSVYGIHRAGYVHEDWGFFARGMHQGSLSLLAAARRGDDLFTTGRLYQALLQPFYEALPYSPGQLAGHGHGPSFDVGTAASALYPVLSYLYPDDPLVGFAMRQTHLVDGDARQRDAPLPEALFGRGFDETAEPSDVADALGLPVTFFDPDRGLLNARSSFAPDATVLSFDCRMDTWDLTRVHSDRNHFTLHALERAWFIDGDLPRAGSEWHAHIQVDGVGPANAPRMPGLLLGFGHEPSFAFATGDASAAYRFSRSNNSGSIDTGYVWADFRYQPAEPTEEWRTHAIRAESEHNPLLVARRTAALGRGRIPFVVVLDEIDKDGARHDYSWRAPVAPGLEAEAEPEGGVLLRHELDESAGPRLLVRALSPAALPELSVEQAPLSTGGTAASSLLVVNATATAPRFVVVMVPLSAEQPLPETTWDEDALTLTVTTDGLGQSLVFERAAAGHFELARSTALPGP